MTDTSENPNHDDFDLEAAFELLQVGVLAADLEFLQNLKKQTADEFDSILASASTTTVQLDRYSIAERKIHPMKTTALVASLSLLFSMCWFVAAPSTEASILKLGDVLQEIEKVESLQLRVTRDGHSNDVWVNNSGVVRWEDSPQRYQLARGAKLWEVTDAETTTPQVSSPVSNPWRGQQGELDLVALMGMELTSSHQLLEATPDGIASYSGIDCLVFRELVKTPQESIRLNFYVNEKNKELLAVTACPKGARRTGPPLVELALIAKDIPLKNEKFRIPVKLSEDNRIGKLVDSQGIVTLRPLGSTRWTPITGDTVLHPNDWLRTDVRGANALTLELASGVKLIAGPGSLLEINSSEEVQLHSGTVQVQIPKSVEALFTLKGMDGQQLLLGEPGKSIARLDENHQLQQLKSKPVWLKSYEGSSVEDSIGSLIVEIDGRATPLTVGEHHVTVEIRDQIARTTIEETFVNHTDRRMEGQFHFPLPQDASISGFGMWIAGELIEADVVEKQRAREIYETILREKRDPGLLEWAGGNIFKARVFPIEPHSEKRVKIVYTQVLPLQGNRFRYCYGLKSEMLQTNPLRELSIRCLVNSTVPLSAVECTSHTCRTQLTDHSSELEFVAQDYSPTKDFEVICDVSQRENDVVMIPHRRGDDGYFLMELMPPGDSDGWQRKTIGESDPLELILLCDTSGSMDSSMRRNQLDFVVALLSSLGEKDRVAIATTDVKTNWLVDDFSQPSESRINFIRNTLEERASLGWSDLDQAFDAVLKKATPQTQVIYVGDGIVATTDSDPVAFANRLKLRYQNQFGANKNVPAFHAVSVGSTFESIVLKGIASLGKGSQRQIMGEITPAQAVLDLLQEMTGPGLKDIEVQFEGIQVAAVYPEQLPNIPAGTQQILVGRYLPTGKKQTGQVVVTGTMAGRPVKYVAKIQLADAEAGNSFIPRLWARAHLEQLLQQGSSRTVQEQVIALSEEFHIITPYTSLLVLESDADRERFGVKRRFGMRDGEQFFADGRTHANYELKQQQMQNAGLWRVGLRQRFQNEFASMGQDANTFQPLLNLAALPRSSGSGQLQLDVTPEIIVSHFENESLLKDAVQFFPPSQVAADAFSFYVALTDREPTVQMPERWYFGDEFSTRFDISSESRVSGLSSQLSTVTFDDGLSLGSKLMLEPLNEFYEGKPRGESPSFGRSENYPYFVSPGKRKAENQILYYDVDDKELPKLRNRFDKELGQAYRTESRQTEFYAGTRIMLLDDFGLGRTSREVSPGQDSSDQLFSLLPVSARQNNYRQAPGKGFMNLESKGRPSTSTDWLQQLFPQFSPTVINKHHFEVKSTWTDEAVELSQSLVVTGDLQRIQGGLEIVRETESWSDDFDRLIPQSQRVEVWSPSRWATVDFAEGRNAIINWRDATQRGVYSESLLLGQVRDLVVDEKNPLPLRLSGVVLYPLHESFKGYEATLEKIDEGRTQLTLSAPSLSSGYRFVVDTERRVVTRQETLSETKITATIKFQNFVQVAGRWLPTLIVSTNAQFPEETSYSISQTFRELSPPEFASALKTQLVKKEKAFLLTHPLPDVKAAQQKIQAGEASLQDHFVLLLHSCLIQDWEESFVQLREMEKAGQDFPGIRWIRIALEIASRRNEDARQRLVAYLDTWSNGQVTDEPDSQRGDLYLVTHILSTLYPIIGWAEYAPVLETVKPFYERQADKTVALLDWQQRWGQALNALKRTDEKIALQKVMSENYPGNVSLQIAYGSSLISNNQKDAARDFFKNQLSLEDHWKHHELTRLRDRYAEMLEGFEEYPALLAFLKNWLQQETGDSRVSERYLSALVYNGQVKPAEQTVGDWLKLAEKQQDLSLVQRAMIRAAISFAFGTSHRLHRNEGMDHKWLPELYRTAKLCLQIEGRLALARMITSNNSFKQSDVGDRLRADVLGWLLIETGQLPLKKISLYTELLHHGRLLTGSGDDMEIRQVTTNEWEQIAEHILLRWESAKENYVKQQFAQLLVTVYSTYLPEKHLPFLRRLISESGKEYQLGYRKTLFNVLQSQSWTAEIEQEAFKLWSTLSEDTVPSANVAKLIPKLYELVDKMIRNRLSHEYSAWQDQGGQDELTRQEKKEQKDKLIEQTYVDLAERLVETSESLVTTMPELLPWLQLERIRIDVELNRNRKQVLQECWSILGDKFATPEVQDELTAEAYAQLLSQSLVQQRAFLTIVDLTAQKNTDEILIDRVLNYVDSAIQVCEEKLEASPQVVDKPVVDHALPWKRMKYKLLILFDRTDQLKQQLEEWVNGALPNDEWQHSLAMLLAEDGEIERAVGIFEELNQKKMLAATDFSILANWYLLLDENEKHQASRVQALKGLGENHLSNQLNQVSQQMRNSVGPHELDEETFLMLEALLQKSSHPENHYYLIRNLYTGSRDFRVLAAVPDSLLGHTQSRVYDALRQFQNSILHEVRKEATADKMLEHLQQLREKIEAGNAPRGADENQKSLALDLRALDLIEALIEAKSAQVLNQPGAHARKAGISLNRAFKHVWQKNEPVAYAQFLQRIGELTVSENRDALQPLTDLILLQLQTLQIRAASESPDSVNIAIARATLLINSFGRQAEGLQVLESALSLFAQQHAGHIPYRNNNFVKNYSSFLQQSGAFAQAENYVVKHLNLLQDDNQRWGYQAHLNQLYEQAFQRGAQVSLGEGNELFLNLLQHLTVQAATPDQNRKYNVMIQIGNLFNYTIGDDSKGPADEKDQLLKFTREAFPELTQFDHRNYVNLVNHFASILNSRISPVEALDFVLTHYESYPEYFEYTTRSPWSLHAWQLAQYRDAAENSKTEQDRLQRLEARLLPIVLAELRLDLVNHRHINQTMYQRNHSYFWNAKAAEFFKVSSEVAKEFKDSPRALFYTANYMHQGLARYQDAISLLLDVNDRGLLDQSNQRILITYLHEQKIYESSIPILAGLLEKSSEEMSLRVQLLRAYFYTRQKEKLTAFTTDTDEFFHQNGLWTETNIVPFARACIETGQLERGVSDFEEAVNLHQQTQPNRGIGLGRLSQYYSELAEGYRQLGNTSQAVDSAAAAIVSWGPQHDQRRNAVSLLNSIILNANDLDQYLKQINQQVKTSGQDSPVIRKAIALRFVSKKQFEQAVEQFQIALALSPGDPEVHQGLLNAYDQMNAKGEAIQQLISQIEAGRHQLQLYVDLANRTKDDPALSERAATSMVESAPNEAESHTALAEFREQQQRWDAAIAHWKQAAKLRKLEPNGLLGLANAQIQTKNWMDAKETVRKLQQTEWPERFNNIENQIRNLDRQIKR